MPQSIPQLTPQMATQFVHQTVPAIGRLGVSVEAVSPGAVDLRVPIEGNANHMGTMYAGALFALVELPGGLLPLGVARRRVHADRRRHPGSVRGGGPY